MKEDSQYIRYIGGLYAGDLQRRHKVCKYCDVSFCDVTKRNLKNTCSKACHHAAMVATRRLRGSYKRSAIQNARLSAVLRRKRADGEIVNSIKQRKAAAESMIKRWADGSMARKTRETCQVKYGEDHWMKTSDGRDFASKLHTGRIVSIETRQKLSESMRIRMQGPMGKMHSRGRVGFRQDLGLYVRSSWEANIARLLQSFGPLCSWAYEPRRFELCDGLSYTPDFCVFGEYYEVKGWWTMKARLKFDLFRTMYPDCKIHLIERSEYQVLEKLYSSVVEYWEA